jgi:hypothetical protein
MGQAKTNSYILIDGEVRRVTQVINVSLSTALTIATSSIVRERRIERSSLPPVVETAVAAHSSGATIEGFREEKENRETFYEAEMPVKDDTEDIFMADTGALVAWKKNLRSAN